MLNLRLVEPPVPKQSSQSEEVLQDVLHLEIGWRPVLLHCPLFQDLHEGASPFTNPRNDVRTVETVQLQLLTALRCICAYCHLMNWFRKPACKFFPNIDDHGSCLENEGSVPARRHLESFCAPLAGISAFQLSPSKMSFFNDSA